MEVWDPLLAPPVILLVFCRVLGKGSTSVRPVGCFFVRMDVDVLFGEVYHGLIMCFVHLVCIV